MPLWGQATDASFRYWAEVSALASDGGNAPLWFTANRYGAYGVREHQALVRTGVSYRKEWKRDWRIDSGLELAGGSHLVSPFWLQQAYVDVAWKKLVLSMGCKQRPGFPLDKRADLSSGWLVEGPNARPVPQVRAEIGEYLAVPGTGRWLALKGHLAYGWFLDGPWQEEFAGAGKYYVKGALYHSKSLMFRVGNRERLPLELEVGLLMATQFGGSQYLKHADGSSEKTMDMPGGLNAYWKAFLPQAGGANSLVWEQVNVEGNMLGSWNFAVNWYPDDWRVRMQYEHYFEDHSQMFWEYGRWKDGQLGIEVSLPANRWISCVLWEGLSTKDQTKGVLYDGAGGSFGDLQMSGGDNYYNHLIYRAWQYYGQGMGTPLLPGPAYNADGSLRFKSNRVRANHLGVCGQPAAEWRWRLLASFARHWGTYNEPLLKQCKQFSGLLEVSYVPAWTSGWSASVSMGLDRGNYLGNRVGGMFTLRKSGGFAL